MKKVLFVVCSIANVLLFGCASQKEEIIVETVAPTIASTPMSSEESNILVTYFSRTGHTKDLAEYIGEVTGGAVFEIVPSEAYPEDYEETVARFREERKLDARPELATEVENIDAYDVVFIGYPIWGGDIPYVVRTFLDTYDLRDKVVIPFCTNGGSRFGNSLNTLDALCDGEILEGYEMSGSLTDTGQNEVKEWLENIGYLYEE